MASSSCHIDTGVSISSYSPCPGSRPAGVLRRQRPLGQPCMHDIYIMHREFHIIPELTITAACCNPSGKQEGDQSIRYHNLLHSLATLPA